VYKHRRRVKQYGTKLYGRSKLTNGTRLLPTIDHRSIWARRFSDLNHAFRADLGATDCDDSLLSEGQRALVRRASALCVELEAMEIRFARNKGAKPDELDVFQRAVNSLRRIIESLGTHRGRIPRDITGLTLGQVLRQGIDQPPTSEAAE
jgi:hypothetical protein